MSNFSANEIVEMAVQIEKSGYAYYNQALKNDFLSADAKELLTFLRDQEEKHEKYFLSLRDNYDLYDLDMTQDWELISSYIKMITDSRMFSDEKSAIRLLTQAENDLFIINNAIIFEKDTLLFFHAVKDNIKNEKSKTLLQEIIQEEISHVFRLNDYKLKHF